MVPEDPPYKLYKLVPQINYLLTGFYSYYEIPVKKNTIFISSGCPHVSNMRSNRCMNTNLECECQAIIIVLILLTQIKPAVFFTLILCVLPKLFILG